jgi:hypothetical protein
VAAFDVYYTPKFAFIALSLIFDLTIRHLAFCNSIMKDKLVSVKSPFTWLFLLGSIAFSGCWLLLKKGAIHDLTFTGGDASGYMEAGKYLWLDFKLHYFRTFGYAIFTGLPQGFGASEYLSRYLLVVLNGVFYISSALLLYDIMQRISGIKVYAFAMAIIYIFSPGIIFINYATLSEPLFVFSLLLSIKFLVMYGKSKDPEDLLWFCLTLLFSAAVRPVNLYFAVIMAALVLFMMLRYSMGKRNMLLLLTGVFLMVVLPMLGMQKLYGIFTYTHNSKYMLYHYTCSYANSIPQSSQVKMYDSFHKNALTLDTLGRGAITPAEVNWVRRDSLYTAGIRNTLKQRKKQLAVAWFNNLKENASTPSHLIPEIEFKSMFVSMGKFFSKLSSIENIMFSLSALFLVTYLVLYSLFQIIKKKIISKDILRFFLAAQIMVLIGLGALSFWQGDRFSIVMYPLLLILIHDILFNRKDIKANTINP